MKEQEVICFDVWPDRDDLTDTINERIALLNAQGKRVVNIGFPQSPLKGVTGVCILYEKE